MTKGNRMLDDKNNMRGKRMSVRFACFRSLPIRHLSLLIFFMALFTVSLLFMPAAEAIRLTPAKYEIGYAPNSTDAKTFYVDFKDTGQAGKMRIDTYGGLASSVNLSEQEFTLAPNEVRLITVAYTQADALPPGTHSLYVRATEVIDRKYGQDQATVGAVAAVTGRIVTHIPYPHKYLEITTFELPIKAAVGSTVFFKTTVINRGSETVDKVIGNVVITDTQGKQITTVPLTEASGISPGSEAPLFAEWNTQGATPGQYHLKPVLKYDGDVELAYQEHYLLIGDKDVDIVALSPQKIPAGKITKGTATVKSIWNDKISFYVELSMKDAAGNVLSKTTSQNAAVDSWQSKEVELFLDATNIKEGTYTAEIVAFFEGLQKKKSFALEVQGEQAGGAESVTELQEEPKSEKPFSLGILPIVFIALLVLVIVFIGYRIARRNEE